MLLWNQLVIQFFFYLSLGLAEMELNFLKAACTVLCFGSVAKTVLITRWCFGCCWTMFAQCQGFLSPPHHPTSLEWEAWGGQEIGRVQSWDSWPELVWGIVHIINVMLSHEDWKQRKKVRGGLPSRVPAARRLAGHWFACGRWWVISLMSPPCFFPCVKLPLSWPINFLVLLYFTPLATQGGEGGTPASGSVAAWPLSGINPLHIWNAGTHQHLKPAF